MKKYASILSIGGVQRAFFLKPLAVLLALLMLPPELPVLGHFSLVTKAKAQPIVLCPPGQGAIFQACDSSARLSAFEAAELQNFVADYNLNPADAQLIYNLGRADLRTDFRAYLFNRLLLLITEAPANRTQVEQDMYNYFAGKVQGHEIAMYTAATQDRDKFLNNYCTWTPDLDIEGAYDVAIDVAAYCGPTVTSLPPIFGGSPQLPTKDYFLTKGYKEAYTTPMLAAATSGVPGLQLDDAQVAEIASIASAGVIGAPLTSAAISKLRDSIFPAAKTARNLKRVRFLRDAARLGENVDEDLELPDAIGATLSRILGPAGVVLLLATIVIGAILAAQAEQDRIAAIQGLNNDLANAQANPVDLASFINTDQGLEKVRSVFLEISFPEFPSAQALPSPASTDPKFVVNSATVTNQAGPITFKDASGNTWSALPYGTNWIVMIGTDSNGNTVTRFNNRFSYMGVSGGVTVPYLAWINNGTFMVAKLNPHDTDAICDPGPNGLYTGDTTNCHSYTTNALQMLDASGNPMTVTMSQGVAFTSASYAGFASGTAKSITLRATGIPAPSISVSGLPSGLSASTPTSSPGVTTIQLNEDGTTPIGNYSAQVQISNSASSLVVPFSIFVDSAIHITSPSTLTMTYGQPVNFTVTATGNPVKYAIDDIFPAGITATDNGDGTATVAGTPFPDISSTFCVADFANPGNQCGIRAFNNVFSDFQKLAVTVNNAPSASITSASKTLFFKGQPGSFLVAQNGGLNNAGTGFYRVVDRCTAGNPAWLTETLLPNGDMILSGTPPPVSGPTTHLFMVFALALNGAPDPPQAGAFCPGSNFELDTDTFPSFQPPNFLIVPSGTLVPSTVFSTSNTFNVNYAITGTLPGGITLQNNGTGFFFSGTVPANTLPGDYPLAVTATAGDSNEQSTERFDFVVGQAPTYAGFTTFNLVINQPANLVFNPSGFPKNPLGQLPGMTTTFNIAALPAGMSQVPGVEAGSVVLTGTPTQLFQQTGILVSKNGQSPDFSTGITIRVINPGDINADGVVDCNDIAMVKAALNTKLGFPGYNNLADVNNDGIVNVQDLLLVAKNLPAGTHCP